MTPEEQIYGPALGEFSEQMADSQAIADAFNRPTLKEKLSKVAAHCAYVRKDGVNLFHKYNYATASTIFEKVNEALIENRLVSCPTFKIEESKERQNAKGGFEHLVTVSCLLGVFDIDSPSMDGDRFWCTALGSGQDNGDKAVMKAQTAALKYAWMMLLNISTGDDPEDDAKVDSRMSGTAINPKKSAEDYAATVEANKRAQYSPLAVELSDQINAALNPPAKGTWPGEPPPEPSEQVCKCGSTLVRKITSKAKGSKPYLTCELSDKAFRKDEWAANAMAKLEEEGICKPKEHTWMWLS